MLVATDCLSEGVNLQEHFQAVVHYDLAWNPTRHEQREGRVDRFGQRATIVRAVTLYGTDNGIDGIVLDVLLRKHEQIRKALGISVPVPTAATTWSRPSWKACCCATHPASSSPSRASAWNGATTCTANGTAPPPGRASPAPSTPRPASSPREVARELAEMRASLGLRREVEAFTAEALSALHADITQLPNGFRAATAAAARRPA